MVKVERKEWNSMRILYWYESISNNREVSIEEQYEFLTNLILAYGGRIHGSQLQGSSGDQAVAVYFQIPTENKEEFLKEEDQD